MSDITWYAKPAWGFGDGKFPTNFSTYVRRLYSSYTSSNYTQSSAWGSSFEGLYILSVHNINSIKRSGSNARGTMPNSWIGPTDISEVIGFTRTIMTLVYPKADRRVAFEMKIVQSGTNYAVSIESKWYKISTGAQDSVVTYPGFATSAGWLASYLAKAGLPGVLVCQDTVADKTYQGFAIVDVQDNSSNMEMLISGYILDVDAFTTELQGRYPAIDFSEYETIEESPEAGEASQTTNYGGGTHAIWQSDTVGVPDLPTLSGCDLGFVNMYMPMAGDLQDLGEEIFPSFDWQAPSGNDVVDALLNIAGLLPNVIDMYANKALIDYVQDVHLIPVAPVTGGNEYVKLGYRTMNTNCAKITSDYVEVDCKTVNIRECFGQFLDYQPFTRARLYLPFVGFVPIEPEYWQNGELGVIYHFNVRDGSFIVYVTSTPSRVDGMVECVIGQYSGNACIHIPLTGLNYSSMVSGIIGGAAASMVGAAAGNPAAAAMAALNTASAAPQVQYSNGYNGSAAFMGVRVPYLIIERTVEHFPELYAHDVGIPSRVTKKLGNVSGFTVVKDVDLSGFQATEEEKAEIRKLLASGIYV